jgi:hypothetical protein
MNSGVKPPSITWLTAAPASISARPDQRPYHRQVALFSGDAQRRRAVMCSLGDVRARADKHPHHRLVAELSGDVQRRRAVIIRLVAIGTRLDKRSNHNIVAFSSGHE